MMMLFVYHPHLSTAAAAAAAAAAEEEERNSALNFVKLAYFLLYLHLPVSILERKYIYLEQFEAVMLWAE